MLIYEQDAGVLRWRVTSGRAIEGQQAGGIDIGSGYHKIRIKGFGMVSHHVAWAWMTGEWPLMVDHIDGVTSNNVWQNLRLCTQGQNMANRRSKRKDGTGLKGVSKHKASGKFQAQIGIGGKNISLGLFAAKEDAHAAYMKKATEVYGEFASDGIKAENPVAIKRLKRPSGPPTVEEARKFLSYDPNTGNIRWKIARGQLRGKGEIAGRIDTNGYRRILMFGRLYSAHRLAFLIVTGRWPTLVIDHINRRRDDNRWLNLRECTQSENILNAHPRPFRLGLLPN